MDPQPDDSVLADIYSHGYFLGETGAEASQRRSKMKSATGNLYLDSLASLVSENARLLEIGCGHGEVLAEARRRGFRIAGVEVSSQAVSAANRYLVAPVVAAGTVETLALPRGHFGAVLAADVIEHVRDPEAWLLRIYDLLTPGGVLLLITPSLDSWTRRLMRRHWMEYKVEHLYYFSAASITRLLKHCGFADIRVSPSRKVLTVDYLAQHFNRFRVPVLSPLIGALRWMLPGRIAHRHILVPASGLMAIARKPGTGSPIMGALRLVGQASAPAEGLQARRPLSLLYMEALERRGFLGGALLDLAAPLASQSPAAYDAAILLDELQNQPDPGDLLRAAHTALRPGAPLLLTVRSAGGRWCFDENAIQLLLLRCGFHQVLARRLPGSRLLVTATRDEPRARPKCSIIVAAYNECRTFSILMDALLKKSTPGVDREIIVVESNSTDGTRALAMQYQDHPDIKLVLEDAPRGKGHAIREALRHATGDIILIQDADLEYDLNDYDALLAPLLSYRSLFVLGTRHAGDWKMRRFTQQKVLATGLNLGHAFFTGLINLLFRQNMTDPFTMFKVFRRDCLFGLDFQCNRFDFDHELVIKLVRKGYRPLEIPVNYTSRSFREGKKVRIFRDPFTWLWVDLRLRFTRSAIEPPL